MAAKTTGRKPVGKPIARPRTPQEKRAAADNLGAIYRHFLRYNRHYLPFGGWAIPKPGPLPQPHPGLLAALVDESVYRSDAVRDRLAKKLALPFQPAYELYRADYDAVMPDVFAEATKFARSSLKQEDLVLGNFKFRLENEPGLPDRLSTAAAAVLKDAGGVESRADLLAATIHRAQKLGCVPADFEKAATDEQTAVEDEGMKKYLRTMTDREAWLRGQELRKVTRERIAKSVRAHPDDVLKTLFAHPRGIEILDALSKDATKGVALALGLIQAARDAIFKLNDELATEGQEEHALRYPFFVVGAVRTLKYDDVPGFKEYAVAVGQAKANEARVPFLDFAGMAVACLALVFSGPVGAFVIGVADLALAGTSTALAFIREREHELAATASRFREEDRAFAEDEGYGETALAAAAAFLSAFALFKARSELAELIKNRPKSIPEALAAEAVPVAPKQPPGATKIDPSALERKVDGVKATGPAHSGVTAPAPPATPPPATKAARMTENKLAGSVPETPVKTGGAEEAAGARATDASDLVADPESLLQEHGISARDRPPVGTEPAGKLIGEIGEGMELVDAGITTPVRHYQSVLSSKARSELMEMLWNDLRRGDPNALRKHIERLSVVLPPEGLKEVELFVPVRRGKATEFGLRKPDRLFVDEHALVDGKSMIALVESKRHTESALEFAGRVKKQIGSDVWLLERFPYARYEYFISGNVTRDTLQRLQALEARFRGRFRIRMGPDFNVI